MMTFDLAPLETAARLLFEIPLRPMQGQRFQPTGFPGLGAATFQTSTGLNLLVESAQSMANRMEAVCWDSETQDLRQDLQGLSHVRVTRNGTFLTDSVLEAHRLNSPYLLAGKDKSFLSRLKEDLGGLEAGPIDRAKLAEILLKYDVGSLIHGVFFARPDLAGGRLRVSRALSAFIEADDVRVAPSGGVKNDHVFPQGDTKAGFGNVPFARDEFTAGRITLYVNLDLGQIRGYGLGSDVERLLVLLSLYKVRALLEGSLRLRTACDLEPSEPAVAARSPAGFELPLLHVIASALKAAIGACAGRMQVSEAAFEDEMKKGKDKAAAEDDASGDDAGDDEE